MAFLTPSWIATFTESIALLHILINQHGMVSYGMVCYNEFSVPIQNSCSMNVYTMCDDSLKWESSIEYL